MSKLLLEVKNLNTFYGKSHILQGIDLSIYNNDCLALLGRNGAGKTTTLRSLVNLTKPKSGTVFFNNENLKNKTPYTISSNGMTLVPEHRGMFSSLSVDESLDIVRYSSKNSPWSKESILELFPALKNRIKNKSSELSGGEQQMLAISRALLTNPRLLLLDEPTQGLAPNIVNELSNTLSNLLKDGLTIIIVEQNIKMAVDIANKVSIIVKGETKWDGTKEEFTDNIIKYKKWLGT